MSFFLQKADGSKPRARAACRQQKQGSIARSVRELGGTLTLTFRLQALIVDIKLLMP